MQKLLIIDGNSILNRSYYGIRTLTNKNGLFTNAVYGLCNILIKNLQSLNPDYAVIAFDLKAPTFRHKYYDQYKANRHKMPDELAVQFPYAKKAAQFLGFTVVEKEGFEADDILGSYAKRANENGVFAYILTGDKDSLQLINDKTEVLLATNTDTVPFDTAKFIEKYSLLPSQMVDLKALMGDSSDNIPGVNSVGEKTAIKLLSKYQTLDNLYAALENGTADDIKGKLRENLINYKSDAYLSQYLAKIERDMPLEKSLSDVSYKGFDNENLIELFKELDFSKLLQKIQENSESDTQSVEKKQIDITAKAISKNELYSLDKSKKYACIISETALYLCDGENAYIFEFSSISEISEFLSEYSLIVHDIKQILHKFDVSIPNADDIMLMGYVASSNDHNYSLEYLSLKYLMQDLDKDTKCEVLCQNIYLLYEILNENLISTNQEKIYKDIEIKLAYVLFDMEKRGFSLDTVGMKQFADELLEMLLVFEERIYSYAGAFNINSPKQLGEILFEKLGLPTPKKKNKSGGYSTDAETLQQLRPYHSIISDILEYRQIIKLKNTYADVLYKIVDQNGKIHTTFLQTGTATGRLSSIEPNLQNIPVRQEYGKKMRKYFISQSDDYLLVDADYSQIELRLLAAISGDKNMIWAYENGVDIHSQTAAQVFGAELESVTPQMRSRAKAVNFGIMYGIGEYSLSLDIGVTRKAAAEYIANYLKGYPKVDEYLKNTIQNAKNNAYTTTIFGRRRYIPELLSSKKTEIAFGERIAMNSPIQGAAADIIKIAMINIFERLKAEKLDAHMILQVHDELIIQAHKDCVEKVAEILKYEMENAVSLAVKLSVETGIGKNWLDAK